MSTMAVVTQAETAPAIIRWAARFARMRKEKLTVFCSLIGTPKIPTTPVNSAQPEKADEIIQTAV